MAALNLLNAASVLGQTLSSSQLPSGNTTIYTVPANTTVKVAKLVLANVTGTAVNVSVSVLRSGDTVDTTHRVTGTFSLAANDSTVVVEAEGMFLGEGAFISVNAGTAAAVNATLNGLVLS